MKSNITRLTALILTLAAASSVLVVTVAIAAGNRLRPVLLHFPTNHRGDAE